MHTRRRTARAVTAAGGDHMLALKGNQGAPYGDMKPYAADPAQDGNCLCHRDVDGSHGRIGTRYLIMSAKLSPQRFRHAVRGRWVIGNPLHWVLDMTMNGDRRRNRTGHGPGNLAPLRRPASNVARIEPGRDAMRCKPKRTGWNNNLLPDMIRATEPHKPEPTPCSQVRLPWLLLAARSERPAFEWEFPACGDSGLDR